MYDDFCSECQFRQNPMMQPFGQMGCGGQMPMPMPMQGTMGAPSMQGNMMPSMQNPMMPSMQNPMPPMQPQYNIYQPMSPMPSMTPAMEGTGVPTSQTQMQTPPMGPSPIPGVTFPQVPGSPVYQDPNYMQGHLRSLIGRYVKVEFLIGTNSLIDRDGVLLEVGISFIVLREAQTDDNLMCDIYSIKFVRAYY